MLKFSKEQLCKKENGQKYLDIEKKEIVWARIWLNYAKGGIKYLSVCGPLIIGY